MAQRQIRGTVVPLNWGTTTTTGYITDQMGEDTEGDNVEITDETNQFVLDISGLECKDSIRLSVIPLDSVATPPVPGDVFAYGPGGSEEYMVVDAVRKVRAKRDVERWDMEGHEHPNIDLTPTP